MRDETCAPHTGQLEGTAREAARSHQVATGRATLLPSLANLGEMSSWLEHASTRLVQPEADVAKAAEWLLDNAYLVRRAIRQIGDDMSVEFYQHLPALADAQGTGAPRVYAVARTLAVASTLQFTVSTIIRFVNAYQERTPLDLSELWALPVMLRLVCIEELATSLERLDPALTSPIRAFPFDASGPYGGFLEETECVARAARGLKAISDISWQQVVPQTSVVESTLAGDPAAAYALMDSETRERYRDVVELLARYSKHPEVEIAEQAVQRARGAAEAHDGGRGCPKRC